MVNSYPAALPCPTSAPIQAAERRHMSTLPGPRQSRPFQRDRKAAQQLHFVFPSLALVQSWLDWFEATEGAWFAAEWPQPQGGVGVRRFTSPPTYEGFLPKRRGWGVTISCEVRGGGVSSTLSYQQAVLADHPLVYWKLDETAGSAVGADSGSTGLPLALNTNYGSFGAPTLTGEGSALSMTAAGANACTASHSAALNFGSGDFTFSAVIKTSATITGKATIVAHELVNSLVTNWSFHIDVSGNLGLWLSTANSIPAVTGFVSNVRTNDGFRHHVVGRRIGTAIALLQDMVHVGSGSYTQTIYSPNAPVGVGCSPRTGGADPNQNMLIGTLDEVAIWNRGLSDAALQAHFDTLS